MRQFIEILEVGPRDGFQNQKTYIEKETKLQIIDSLVQAGVQSLQVTSFVSPKAVPQMADAADVASTCVSRYPDRFLFALAPNLRGAANAYDAGIRSISYVVSLSETHNLNNIRRTHQQSMEEFRKIRETYPDLKISLDLATTFGCPFEGRFPAARVVDFIGQYVEEGLSDVDLCDTIGIGDPRQVRTIVEEVRKAFPSLSLQVHIHDTRNMGMVNTLAAIEAGITRCQSTLGGLGGCPFAPGASGNLATEDLVYMLDRMGFETGIDPEALVRAAKEEYRLLRQEGNFSGHLMKIEKNACTGIAV